ncbi:DUF2783 domain-containing protein [Dankookia rubra]|uniref:DUF2783 domain-containing protein n=1 Tax=Dankookia rubra TaxID=1442381 RepID=A0A4R5Q798_9PROT|nr:DUF2783 domain-containing protein [Dankookia rubra]TDH58433.1 DUF2783 domain-containing protein [Dankookia rubra]
MLPKRLSTPALEDAYDQLAEALDETPADRRVLFLAKLALALANLLDDPAEFAAALEAARRDLG